jgi:co-chaperonin GroES (HSP10)
MIQAAQNFILAEIEKKFQDQEGNLFVDTTWHPEEYATLEGIVISAPSRTESDNYRKVVGSVKNGDRIFFSYGVIFDYKLQPDNDTPIYKNLIIHEGKEYWKVEIGEVFCKVNTDGSLEMVTDNILLEPVAPEKTEIEGLEIIQNKESNSGIVKAMPKNINLSCNVRDEVCFEPRFVQKYNIFGKEHFIIPSRRIIAKKWI